MRKHKNLNKQELMIRQDIPCVHLGGKFVPLKSRVKSLLGEKRKKRAEKVLATVVMGMNLVNVTAPVAALAAAGKTVPAPVQPLRSDAAAFGLRRAAPAGRRSGQGHICPRRSH